MLSHLGRHSVEQGGAKRSVDYMKSQFGSEPGDLLVWISPSVGQESYPLDACPGRSIKQEVIRQLESSAITLNQIEISTIDTAVSDDYFSHSEYLEGNRSDDGRFAVVIALP